MRQIALGTTPANVVNAFGGGALDSFANGLPWRGGFALLAAYAAMAVALGPVAMAAACRNALS